MLEESHKLCEPQLPDRWPTFLASPPSFLVPQCTLLLYNALEESNQFYFLLPLAAAGAGIKTPLAASDSNPIQNFFFPTLTTGTGQMYILYLLI